MPKATRILFEGYAVDTGTEPYIVDPLSGSTRLLRDIASGTTGSAPGYGNRAAYFGALAGGLTVFGASDGRSEELWITDGTTVGTKLLVTINPGGTTSVPYGQLRTSIFTSFIKGSAPADFINLTATGVLFTAGDAARGIELWITDGTAAGTRLVSDVRPGTGPSYPNQITALGDGRALFVADDGVHGRELWVTDGTAAGTMLVSDMSAGSTSTFYEVTATAQMDFVAVGSGRALFTAYTGNGYGLWTTNGTAAGTSRLLTLDFNGYDLNRLGNGTIVFTSFDAVHGTEPWVTDGTAAGTHLLRDIRPGSDAGMSGLYATGFGVLGDGRAVFFASNVSAYSQPQLWITDGTADGTIMLRDFGQTSTDGAVYQLSFLQLADGRISFSAREGLGPFGVWVTDGTAAGTQRLGTGTPGYYQGALSGAALVDAPFYVSKNPDVAAAGQGAVEHYNLSGWHEGRDPDALFSTAGYLNEYTDVKAAGMNPLEHYDTVGWREGRDPSAGFDTSLYLLFNPDVRAAGLDPLRHWLAHGQVEGRKMSAVVDSDKVRDLFDPTFYGLGNADVTAAGVDLVTHFSIHGVQEGRDPDAYFDVKYYLAQNADVASAGINPVTHYLNFGWKEGRDPSAHFSTTKYLAAYADVKAAGVNPLAHFLANGIAESRSGFGDRI